MNKIMNVALLCLLSLISTQTHAATLNGVSFPDTIELDDTRLFLNGMGTRQATLFKVKVYVIGLYVSEQSENPTTIIQSTNPRRIIMQFLRNVDAKKIRDGWQKGFKKNTADTAGIQHQIDQFNQSMPNLKKGDTLKLDISRNTTTVIINNALVSTLEGTDFQQALLSIWLGPKPPNDTMKMGMLGK